MASSFMEIIEAQWVQGKHVCVGLDPDLQAFQKAYGSATPVNLRLHLERIITNTAGVVACYKPNIAFFEADGVPGLQRLETIMKRIRSDAPGVPVILDAKRGDIGNTNEHYARMAFDYFGADAITIHPYLGWEANKPFLDRADKGIFVLCRTSNPGSGTVQMMFLEPPDASLGLMQTDSNRAGCWPLYQEIARQFAEPEQVWNYNKNCGLVTGATYPDEISQVRAIAPDIPLLIPGVGKQGGDLRASVMAAKHRFIINSSSGIIFADDPLAEAEKLHGEIQAALAEL